MSFRDWDGGGPGAVPAAQDLRATGYGIKSALEILAPPSAQVKIKAITDLVANVATDPAAVSGVVLQSCGDPSEQVRAAARKAVLKLTPAVPAAQLLPKAIEVLGGGERGEEEKQEDLKVLATLCVQAPVEALGFFLGKDENALGPLLEVWAALEKEAKLTESERVIRADLNVPTAGVWEPLYAAFNAKPTAEADPNGKTTDGEAGVADAEGDDATMQPKDNPPSTVLWVKGYPADAELGEVEMRFRRFGDCVVKKEDDKHVVNYQYTRLAYEAKSKMDGKNVRGSTLSIAFGPKVQDHATRHLEKKEENHQKYMRVVAARSGVGTQQMPVFEKKDWVVPEEPAYAWNETMSFDEMLEDYTANGDGKEDLLLRYLVVGGCSNGRAFEARLPFFSRKELLDVREVECFGRQVFYLTFRTAGAAAEAFRIFSEEPEWNCAFAPPRYASERLWIGNVQGLTTQDLQAVLLRFGLQTLDFTEGNSFAQATFSSKDRAVEARNLLFGIETPTGSRLNLDFNDVELKDQRKRMRADDVGWAGHSVTTVPQEDDVKRRRIVAPRRGYDGPVKRDPEPPRPQPRPPADVRCTLYKLEEQYCVVTATCERDAGLPELPPKIKIDQRTKREHCKSHMEKDGSRTAIWHLRAEARRDLEGFDDLNDYLIEKERVGIARTPSGGYVYVVPPAQAFVEYFGLRPTKNLIAIQVEGGGGRT